MFHAGMSMLKLGNTEEALICFTNGYELAKSLDDVNQMALFKLLGAECKLLFKGYSEILADVMEVMQNDSISAEIVTVGLILQLQLAIMIPLEYGSIQILLDESHRHCTQNGFEQQRLIVLMTESMLEHMRGDYSKSLNLGLEVLAKWIPNPMYDIRVAVYLYVFMNLIYLEDIPTLKSWIPRLENLNTDILWLKQPTLLFAKAVVLYYEDNMDGANDYAVKLWKFINEGIPILGIEYFGFIVTLLTATGEFDTVNEFLEILDEMKETTEDKYTIYEIYKIFGDYLRTIYAGFGEPTNLHLAKYHYEHALDVGISIDSLLESDFRKREITNRINSLSDIHSPMWI